MDMKSYDEEEDRADGAGKYVTFNLWLALAIVVFIALAIGAIAAGFGFWMGWMFGG